MKLLATILILLATTACTTKAIKLDTQVKEVLVPVYQCPNPPIIHQPAYYTDTITNDSTPGETVKAYVLTVKQCRQYSQQLEMIIKGYRK